MSISQKTKNAIVKSRSNQENARIWGGHKTYLNKLMAFAIEVKLEMENQHNIMIDARDANPFAERLVDLGFASIEAWNIVMCHNKDANGEIIAFDIVDEWDKFKS